MPDTEASKKKLGLIARIIDISARLVVNPAALKLKRQALRPLIDAFEQAVGTRA